MAIDLPVATTQPYPTTNPWYDMSQFLTAGLTPFYPGSVLACPEGNFVHYTILARIDRTHPDLEDIWLLRNLPVPLRVAINTPTTGWFTGGGIDTPHLVEISYGVAVMNRWASMGIKLADFSIVSLSATAPRRIP